MKKLDGSLGPAKYDGLNMPDVLWVTAQDYQNWLWMFLFIARWKNTVNRFDIRVGRRQIQLPCKCVRLSLPEVVHSEDVSAKITCFKIVIV